MKELDLKYSRLGPNEQMIYNPAVGKFLDFLYAFLALDTIDYNLLYSLRTVHLSLQNPAVAKFLDFTYAFLAPDTISTVVPNRPTRLMVCYNVKALGILI